MEDSSRRKTEGLVNTGLVAREVEIVARRPRGVGAEVWRPEMGVAAGDGTEANPAVPNELQQKINNIRVQDRLREPVLPTIMIAQGQDFLCKLKNKS